MKYLKKFNESLSELEYSQRYTGGNRPALTAEIKAEIDKIHSGCTKEDIEDVFREIYDEEIGKVNKVEFYYGIDKQKDRYYGYSQLRVEIIVEDKNKIFDYFKIRNTAIDRIRDMYGYSSAGHYHLLRQNDTGQDVDKLDFNSTKIYWITPRIDESDYTRMFNLEETSDYIKDICWELKDDGFTICGGSSGKNLYDGDAADIISLSSYSSSIEINKFDGMNWDPNKKFELPEVYDTISTLMNYMESRGYKTHIYINSKDPKQAEIKVRSYLNDITPIIDKLREAGGETEQQAKLKLSGLGPIGYVKLYFQKPQSSKYMESYQLFLESVKFNKQPQKKGAKTDTYNVSKGGKVIGQIKWSSRMRGYSFQPTKDCDSQIKEFVKDLMRKRRESKKKK